MLSTHIATMLGVSLRAANQRLSALRSAGLLRAREGPYGGHCHQITRQGLAVVGSSLPSPRFDVSTYWHDVGLAWLCLAASRGAFGEVSGAVSERQMRSSDATAADRVAEPFGVRLGGLGAGGRPRLHHPDLLLESAGGHRVAIELELSSKTRTHRERILSGYAFDRRIDAVVYLVEDPKMARAITASVRRLGLEALVHVQRFQWDPMVRPAGRSATARAAVRAPAVGHAACGREREAAR